MRLIIHLVNMFFWTLVLPIFTLAFSYLFDFSYMAAIHNEGFIFCESFFSIVMMFVYLALGSETEDDKNPLALINPSIV